MSGDIKDTLPIPEAAGIIPRVLHSLFERLGQDGSENREHSLKCSFIELYNEELRDLLAADDNAKLKIYDEASKNGRTTTMVQGMEESFIKTASKGIRLLREGSHKRQVAATKCNDLSSRSHTVFTITVYVKRPTETGEDFVSAGKLNLVDLAGSENIQRSGAENKRAAEAGLINKSLLTLGRVINALVDKSSHIPYRESKLTRLLQDSLGGRTKTCIIATLSPAKSNLEETISTLDYAFRAKNIRNKPQMNQTVSKKTLLREFTTEIEKLKSELIATRHRNGVYLTAESYEEITTQSESRRILSEEQRDRIETMETNLRNRIQELFVLTSNFQSIKKDNEQARTVLDGTKNVLDKTELVLAHTKKTLAEESYLRKAHQETEDKLVSVGECLIGTLGTTTDHIDRLHSKNRRRSDLQSVNRTKWADSRNQASETTRAVENRIHALRSQQEGLLSAISGRMQAFVTDELRGLHFSQDFLQEKAASFRASETEVNTQTGKSQGDMSIVLEEVRTLREEVKQKVGAGLNDLSSAARRISAGIASELDTFHGQLEDSYVSLGREFKSIFEDMIRRMNEQRTEAQRLREQIAAANTAFVEVGDVARAQLQRSVEEERETAAVERAGLLANIATLVNDSARAQETRVASRIESANKRIKTSESEFRAAQQLYGDGMDLWGANAQALIDSAVKSREAVKGRLKADWTTANQHTTKIADTTNAVHSEAVRIVNGQMAQMDSQLIVLDEIVERVKGQNEEHHLAHTSSLARLAGSVQDSYQSIATHFETSFERVRGLEGSMQEQTRSFQDTLPSLDEDGDILEPLRRMREDMSNAQLMEYAVTGETPARMQYSYPNMLPRTESHDVILDRMRGGTAQPGISTSATKGPSKHSPTKRGAASPSLGTSSPSKTQVFTDTPIVVSVEQPSSTPVIRPQTAGFTQPIQTLRELDVNAASAGVGFAAGSQSGETEVGGGPDTGKMCVPALKRHHTNPAPHSQTDSKRAAKKSRVTVAGVAEGRENAMLGTGMVSLSASIGPGNGRKLRNRGSD